MDFNKTSKLLKKFKGLHNTLRDSGQEPSGIEKDLLMSYLKELYEQVVTIGNNPPERLAPQPKVTETITASSNGHTQNYEPPKPVFEAAPIAAPQGVEKIENPEPIQASPAVAAAHVKEVIEQAPIAASGPLVKLFADKSVNELSDRLNQLPISDINRAMGINEKVLTINELFNGNQELFSKTILKLNSFTEFDEAKNYLIGGVASDLNWAADNKVKKADKFIQLLRRRYS